ncbi:ogr/Delta-like zinc finger family protein [Novosphingopyxis sp. YJ-S2-01]|uniref:ogr/Delta-like zinc finger family protein n=1 Tax=Novosphingopyxis sp. YJ-S2-01 TaxID=2794021 RepID=UPI0018DB4145|nr:ogr/Delta-like zinc finger family protein [Novosphingopyxis sp. YJ-S2-01]MBH9537914.1 ogr/Delta-like zinc finger family protein [Novosphingopyxis sp. YJ-S2-01]
MAGKSSDPKIACPVCESAARVVRGRNITPLYREVTYDCTNEACGVRFVCSVEPRRIIGQPANVGDCGLPVVAPGSGDAINFLCPMAA